MSCTASHIGSKLSDDFGSLPGMSINPRECSFASLSQTFCPLHPPHHLPHPDTRRRQLDRLGRASQHILNKGKVQLQTLANLQVRSGSPFTFVSV